MRAHLVIALAALVGLSAAACRDSSDPLSPRSPSAASHLNVGIIDTFKQVGPCRPGTVFCPNPYIDVSAGLAVACAIRTTGVMLCWGDNSNGMLGRGVFSTGTNCTNQIGTSGPCGPAPALVAGGNNFRAVSVGVDHVCAIQWSTGAAFCWGNNSVGQLGSPASKLVLVPTAVAPPSGSSTALAFSSIAAGSTESCGVTAAQQLFCWGGKLGFAPTFVSNGVASVSEAVSGRCALSTSGSACQGFGVALLGQGSTASHLCEITTSGSTQCFGDNTYGQLGSGTSATGSSSANPVHVSVPAGVAFTSVATGFSHSCALSSTKAFCWGDNRYGQLGLDGGAADPDAPQQVFTSATFTKITVGSKHTCALDNSGSIWCWGENDLGQVGTGSAWDWSVSPYQAGSTFNGVASPVKILTP